MPKRADTARPVARGRRFLSLLLILGPLLLAAAVHWAVEHQWPLPGCGFRRLTGLPCPTCGSTHALVALARGRLGDALSLNPLLVAACAGSVLGGLWLVTGGRRRPARLGGSRAKARRWGPWILLVAVLANWAWLLWCRP